MGSELVTDELPSSVTYNSPSNQTIQKTFSDVFVELCPYYMAIGMTYDQFWHGDPYLAKAYRKADLLRNEKVNQQLWLQGFYFYNALCSASPILHAFAKGGTKPEPYLSEPLPLTKEQAQKYRERKQREAYEKRQLEFKSQAEAINAYKAKQRSEQIGTND